MSMNIGKKSNDILSNQKTEGKLKLRTEQLDIIKKWVQTGTVTVRKEVIKEEKTIVVPVTREILVIENKIFDSDNINENTKTIQIPISEERIEVIKHPTVLEDIKIYKRQFPKIEHVVTTLKSEKVHVKIIGNAKIKDNETQNEHS
ncbi:YsnF/AvaK domain-containing protein [Neobacillus ginsengisoli]|uniref:Uncharacterized protein (TIGR02271 family) n=1 Tax=Neobacillus ginsengisoli TaxID=904295 RepID=A0ABT9Y116_9BACI|nr:YsnF/AvaK domain-containing protein [Neobacillus ginsengisoli]MDQ0201503.1 uncharacterized protein (TIGR02271 family) [Neobacillus ginsengisoli]